ncbi:hypothetical protein CCR75_004183 [Bremia lactucae]|uniref:Uncharacterized protein n=1 Tax=Bremia lactucae TaxID=4779 RepID=A0A976FK28_BRELC|nr:hypothetical protein CCR75_004183 [Bremia lactucae]
MSGAAERCDRRASSVTEIECDELQPMAEEETTAGWRRLLNLPPQPLLAPVVPAFSLDDLALQKEANTATDDAFSTLAGHAMNKMAARISSHHENRFLQHISRFIRTRGATNKVRANVALQHVQRLDIDGSTMPL